MAENEYIIKYSDSTAGEIRVGENTTDDSTSVTLIGHGLPNYGQPQNENFLHLLENFASREEEKPEKPTIGQLWFKKLDDGKFELNVCSEIKTSGEVVWSKMSQVITSASGHNYSDGDLYYDTVSKKLKVWDSSIGTEGDWVSVGPTDVIHTEHVYKAILVNPNDGAATYTQDLTDIIKEDITETGGNNPSVVGNGSLNLFKMTIMAKEFNNDGALTTRDAKCCVWLYKFLIRSVKTGDKLHNINIVGAPSYELIAKNPDDLNWDVNILLDQAFTPPKLMVNFTLNPPAQNYVTIGFDTEIKKV